VSAARRYGQGFATAEFLASSFFDMAAHSLPASADFDAKAIEQKTVADMGLPTAIAPRHAAAHFQHVFAGSGYSAGYYSYLWSEVLDADAFEAFVEAGDPFDPALAARLK
jgi:peptidyl-dipeptidase Dcp